LLARLGMPMLCHHLTPRATEPPLATKELQELRHKYKIAYTSYMHSVQAISDASQNGVWPAEVVTVEEKAVNELMFVRQALLDALYSHAHPKRRGNGSPKISK
jgi:hypothetical protein